MNLLMIPAVCVRKWLRQQKFSGSTSRRVRSYPQNWLKQVGSGYNYLVKWIIVYSLIITGNRLLGNMQSDARSKVETQNVIDEAQQFGDQLMSFERNKRNSEAQRTIFNYLQSLLDITDLLSEEERSQSGDVPAPGAPDPGSDQEEIRHTTKRVFTKSTVTVEERHNCPHCEWSCENFKSLQRHCRNKHKEKPHLTSRDNEQQQNYVICLLGKRNHPNIQCNKEVVKNRICQHLSLVHGAVCPPKKEYRGFVRKEKGEAVVTAWEVCWLSPAVDDPPQEQILDDEEEDDNQAPGLGVVEDNPQPPQEQVPELEENTQAPVTDVVVDDPPRGEEDDNQDPREIVEDVPQLPQVQVPEAEENTLAPVTDVVVNDPPRGEEAEVYKEVSREVVEDDPQHSQEQVPEVEKNTSAPLLGAVKDNVLQEAPHGNEFMDFDKRKEMQLNSSENNPEAEAIISESENERSQDGLTVLRLSDVQHVLGQDGLFPEADVWVNTDLAVDEVGITDIEASVPCPSVKVGDCIQGENKLVHARESGIEPVFAKYQNNNYCPEYQPELNSIVTKTERELSTPCLDEDVGDNVMTIQTSMINVENDGSYQFVDHEETIMNSSSGLLSQSIISQPESENSQGQEEVIMNSSFGLVGKPPVFPSSPEDNDSQESVYIAGATTNVPSQVEYEESLPVNSQHNTGFNLLPSVPSVPMPLKVQVFKRKVGKGSFWVSNEYENRQVKKAKIDEETQFKDASPSISSHGDLVSEQEAVQLEDKEAEIYEDGVAEDEDILEDTDGSDSEDEPDLDQSDDDDEEIYCKRWERRNQIQPVQRLNSVPENSNVILKFLSWWQTAGASLETKNKDTSTIRMSLRYLFESPDCFINYQTSENPTFNLSRLVNFGSEDFLAVPSPISWVTAVGGETSQDFPSRRTEMLKGHQRIRSYINFCLNEYSFEGRAIQQKDAVAKHLKEIEKQVKKSNLFPQLENLYKSQCRKKAQMTKIIKPLEEENLKHCVRTWFQSKASEELETEALTIYQNAMAAQEIRKSDFDRFSKICFFEAALFDKSRIGMWENLKNADYAAKKSAWLPPDMDTLEYSSLPQEWLLYSEPYPGAPPSSYEIEIISGERSKNHEDHSVVLSPRVFELIEKMIDLKQLIIPEVKLEDYLFVSHSGEKLPKLQRYKGSGSLLYQFGQTCGIEKFCFKMLRKNVEGVIQSSSALKQNTKDLNSHSQRVGQKVYDQLRGGRRNVLLTNLSKQEGGCNRLRNDQKLHESGVTKREERDKIMKDELVTKAKAFLAELKNKSPPDLRPTALKTDDLKFLKSVFKETEVGKFYFFKKTMSSWSWPVKSEPKIFRLFIK